MQEKIDDEMPQLVCLSSNKARMICISPDCQQNGLICLREDCQYCQTKHLYCPVYRLNTLTAQLKSKRQQANVQVLKGCQAMKNIYDESVEKLSFDKDQIADLMQMYGLNEEEVVLFKLLKQQRLSELKGQVTSNVLKKLSEKIQLNITQEGVHRYWTKVKKQFIKIFDNFKLLLKSRWIKLDSKVTDDVITIESFFDKPIYQFKLLYRASENSFDVAKFHSKCDGIRNTIVLAQTQFGKIIGGFTPLAWASSSTYMNDSGSGDKTFLFSISLNEKYNVINQSYTIYGGPGYGPTFGGGHDFYIGNSASTVNNSSYFNFPYSYNNGKYVAGQQSYTAFSGAINGHYAKIQEWEVFEVDFF